MSRRARKAPVANLPTGTTSVAILEGVATPLDILTPGAIDRSSPRSLRVGDYIARSLGISSWPRKVRLGFFQEQLQAQSDVDYALHLEVLSQPAAVHELTFRKTRVEVDLITKEKDGDQMGVVELQQALGEIDQTLNLVIGGEQNLIRATLIGTVYAKDMKESDLVRETSQLEEELLATGMHARPLDAMQDQAWLASLPLGVNPIERSARMYHTLTSGAVAMLMPFTAGDLVHMNGAPLGVNLLTGAPVIIDLWEPSLQNHNMVIYGAAGSGKTISVATVSRHMRALGARVAGIDPEREYSGYVRACGGQVLVAGRDHINPFDVFVDVDPDTKEKAVHLSTKPQDIVSLVEVSKNSPLTVEDKNAIETSVREAYARKGIVDRMPSLTDRNGKRLEMPVISELRAIAVEKGASKELKSSLDRMCQGGALEWLDGQTNVELTSDWVNFDLFDLDSSGDARRTAMHLVTMWLWESFVKREEGRKIVFVDEAWKLARDESAMAFLEEMSRRCRKRDTSFIVVSQDYAVMAESSHTAVLNQNAAIAILMRQSAADLDGNEHVPGVVSAFALSASERANLLSAEQGNAIMRVSNKIGKSERHWLHIEPMPSERTMFKSVKRGV